MPNTDTAAPPGYYGYGPVGKTAQWDGHAWTGQTVDAPEQDGLPKWHRAFLPFLRHAWFWLVLGGSVYCACVGLMWLHSTNGVWAATTAAPGVVVVLVGAVLLITRHLAIRQVPHLGQVAACGVGAGIVAVALSLALEWHRNMWFWGPIEETSKLLVPVLLLVFGGARFRDPRVGLLLVLCSGATFGVIEGVLTINDHVGTYIFQAAATRPVSEIFHPYLTAMAAAVIWLAAWRRARAFTWAGLVAYLIAVVVHGLNDGLPGQFAKPPKGGDSTGTGDLASVVGTMVLPLVVLGVVETVILYFALRFTARELVPPDAVGTNVPGWRPRIRHWGIPPTSAAGVPAAAPVGAGTPASTEGGGDPPGTPST